MTTMCQSGETAATAARQDCRGNVLFLILIAVALFAALSYAVTSSTRNGGGNVSSEQLSLGVSRLLNYGSQMQATVDRMRIMNGIDIKDIYIENNGTKWADNSQRYCCVEGIPVPSRGLFHPQGGGLVLQSFEDLGLYYGAGTKEGHTTYVWANVPGFGTSKSDLIAWTVALKPEVCTAINAKQGITSIPSIDSHEVDFATGFDPGAQAAVSGTAGDLAAIYGKNDICIRYPDGRYFYQRVIYEN